MAGTGAGASVWIEYDSANLDLYLLWNLAWRQDRTDVACGFAFFCWSLIGFYKHIQTVKESFEG